MAPPPNLDLLMVQLQYPEMTASSSAIMRAWLARHGREYDQIYFAVRLGRGTDPGPDYDEATRASAAYSTRKRADAVAVKGDRATIVEIKLRANLSVIGQVQGYELLWRDDHPETPDVDLVVVSARADPDAADVLARMGIPLEIVEPLEVTYPPLY